MTSALCISRNGATTMTACTNLILLVADRWCLANSLTTDQMQTASRNKVPPEQNILEVESKPYLRVLLCFKASYLLL